jgi:hypothetical protein
VPTSEGKKVIEFKSDRRATYELTIDVGREKGRASSVLWKANASPIALHEVDPFRPGHSRVEIERKKVESGALEFSSRGESRRFVGGTE